MNTTKYKVIGTRPIRHDGADKVTGRAIYGADVQLPALVHGKMLRSPHAHARIKSIDTSAAEKLPGVLAVVTSADLPNLAGKMADLGEGTVNLAHLSQNCLAHDKVLYKGHAIAGVAAMEKGRWREAGLWFFAAVVPAVQTRTAFVLWEPGYRQALGAAILMAAVACGAVWGWRRWKNPAPVLAAALLLAPMTLVLSGVRNYPALHHAELDELAAWARTSTTADAVFFFPGAGKALHPGVFRARSLRALYVDWKGGGQINFLREFLPLWLPRWKEVGEPEWSPGRVEGYRARGIDYVVLPAGRTYTGDLRAAFRNGKYAVYELEGGKAGGSQ